MYTAEYYIQQDSYDSDFTSCERWSNPAVNMSTVLVVISWQKRPWSVHRNSLKIRHWDCKLVATLNLTSNVIIIKFDIKVISGFLNYWNSVCVYKYTTVKSHILNGFDLCISATSKKISWWTPSCFLVHTLLFRKGRDESFKLLFKAEARKALFGSLLGAASRKAQVHLSPAASPPLLSRARKAYKESSPAHFRTNLSAGATWPYRQSLEQNIVLK